MAERLKPYAPKTKAVKPLLKNPRFEVLPNTLLLLYWDRYWDRGRPRPQMSEANGLRLLSLNPWETRFASLIAGEGARGPSKNAPSDNLTIEG